jgi:MFS family permease
MELKINIIAILVAVVANFLLGFVWYTPLFGKIWGREMGYDPNVKADSKVLIKGMLFMVIGNFLCAWVLAHNIAAWSFVPGISEMGCVPNALSAAIFTWMGFYLPRHLGATAWEGNSWTLFGINAGYDLLSLIVVSFILTCWV